MPRIVADENFKRAILRGLQRHIPDLDIVRAQQVGLVGADDPTLLAWAAAEGRVAFTHDRATLSHHAYERMAAGLPMPGVVDVRQSLPIGHAIEDILLLLQCSHDDEWADRVRYVPL